MLLSSPSALSPQAIHSKAPLRQRTRERETPPGPSPAKIIGGAGSKPVRKDLAMSSGGKLDTGAPGQNTDAAAQAAAAAASGSTSTAPTAPVTTSAAAPSAAAGASASATVDANITVEPTPPPTSTPPTSTPEPGKQANPSGSGNEGEGEGAAGAEEDEEEAGNWIPYGVTATLVNHLSKDGFLPKDKWRVNMDDLVPTPKDGERVIPASHILRGLGVPPSAFFIQVLQHYGIQPHNLTPNSILYLAGYQALFEGYLGIAPRLDFFQYCFYVKRNSNDGMPPVCGTITFNLRRFREEWFPKIHTSESVKYWTGSYLYLKDVPFPRKPTGIPPFIDCAAQANDNCALDAVDELPSDLLRIKRRISKLVVSKPPLKGMDIVLCWHGRQIQPLSHRGGRLLCTFTGPNDSMRVTKSGMSEKVFEKRINHLVKTRTQYKEMFTAENPPPEVIIHTYLNFGMLCNYGSPFNASAFFCG